MFWALLILAVVSGIRGFFTGRTAYGLLERSHISSLMFVVLLGVGVGFFLGLFAQEAADFWFALITGPVIAANAWGAGFVGVSLLKDHPF
jgi:hypothetical protein